MRKWPTVASLGGDGVTSFRRTRKARRLAHCAAQALLLDEKRGAHSLGGYLLVWEWLAEADNKQTVGGNDPFWGCITFPAALTKMEAHSQSQPPKTDQNSRAREPLAGVSLAIWGTEGAVVTFGSTAPPYLGVRNDGVAPVPMGWCRGEPTQILPTPKKTQKL